jgi:hypothetical protein
VVLLTVACGTLTPEIVRETVEVQVTREVIKEVIITATPMPPPAATLQPPVIFEEDFEVGEGDWFIENLPQSSVSIENGELVIEVKEVEWYQPTGNPILDFRENFELELDVRYVSGPRDAEFGLEFNSQDEDNFYAISIDADGFLNAIVFLEGEFIEILPWTQMNAIKIGTSINHIRFVKDGIQVSYYVNDELLISLPLEVLPRGFFYFYVLTWEEGGAIWAIDNITVGEL